uniref:Uncharacterized protein LOC101504764 n=2 Tax=Cicer arietinum TaxID=3827 RepID=A0A3Q7X4P5_CICAR|nr:uncharacterized protein LOC101504764 [Cicer arietinum]
MGCVLGQHDEIGKKEHAICYLSKKFTDVETRYTMLERTCCALAWAAHRFRQYMLCHTTYLISKMDPIKYIFEKPAITKRIARWQVMLSEYDITYVTQKAIKGSTLADYLANQPVDDYKSMQCEFPDESIMVLSEEYDDGKWTLLFDGASNIMGHGIGVALISPKKKFIPITARLCFDCTNNMAEYEACAMGVLAALESKAKVLEVYGDSALVINQLNQEWETRDKKLIPYFTYIKELSLEFDKITFHHVPREDNQLADALATLSSMFQINRNDEIPSIKMESRDYPAYCHVMEEETDEKPWYHDIKHYLINREYPPGISENEKRTLRRLSASFFVNENILYKRNHDMVLLRRVDVNEAKEILQDIHDGSSGIHMNGHAMSRKILRAGYYWLTLEKDCYNYVKKCYKCQIYADNIHAQPVPLNTLLAPWPFSMWGIDVIGMIEPKASNGHRFILVAIDYFTKWVEAASYANKMVTTYKDWHEMLPFALHGSRTSVPTSTGATLFSLVYGMEVVLPIEVEIPSLRVLMEAKLEESEWVQTCFDQLNLIEEKMLAALSHGQLYQKRLKKAYEKKIRPREFQEGDLVLKKILPIQKDYRGKWSPNYEGPYVLKKAFSGGALILTNMDGKDLAIPVNSYAEKKYYA